MRSRFCFACSLLAAALSFAPLGFGQAAGTISGTIVNPSGAAASAVTVTATNTGTSVRRTAVTDSGGSFTIPLVPVGTYQMRVDQPGFAVFHQENVIVQANSAVQVSIALQLKSTTEQVTVTSSAGNGSIGLD